MLGRRTHRQARYDSPAIIRSIPVKQFPHGSLNPSVFGASALKAGAETLTQQPSPLGNRLPKKRISTVRISLHVGQPESSPVHTANVGPSQPLSRPKPGDTPHSVFGCIAYVRGLMAHPPTAGEFGEDPKGGGCFLRCMTSLTERYEDLDCVYDVSPED
jgi:hypothetical protein